MAFNSWHQPMETTITTAQINKLTISTQPQYHPTDMQIERDFGRDISNNHNNNARTRKNKRRLADLDEGEYENAGQVKRRRLESQPAISSHGNHQPWRSSATVAPEPTKNRLKVKASKRSKPPLKIMAPCDKPERENELACIEYLEEMFQNLRIKETAIAPYMKKQSDINAKMRTILLDWIVEVHKKFKLSRRTLHLAVHLLDRFLSVRDVKRTDLQLLGSASLWVASKYHEIYAPEIQDFIYVSAKAFNEQQMVHMEVELVTTLKFNMTYVIPLTFLKRFIKIFTSNMKDSHRKVTSCLMHYFLENALLNYDTALCKPSKLAAAVVAMSFLSVVKQFSWGDNFVQYTGYELKELLPIVMQLDRLHKKVAQPNSKHHRGLKKKYASSKYGQVSRLTLRPLPFQNLSKK